MKIPPVIIALDIKDINKAKSFVDKFENPTWFKVGMEQTYANGFEIIKYIKNKGHKVFLDLKLFDIPNTVRKSLKSLELHNVDMATVHTLGGKEMLEAASESNINVLGVTILTSTNQNTLTKEMMIEKDMKNAVIHLASIAKESNLFGIVCSPHEANLVKNLGLTIVCPGVRREFDSAGDQKRITTPAQAKANGADYIVVGRPIIQSTNPVATYNKFVEEFK